MKDVYTTFVCVCADEIELIVVPSDQIVAKGEGIFLPCVALSQYTDGSTSVSWRRHRAPKEGVNEVEELKNTVKKVSIFHTEEQRGNGSLLIRSILHLGCLDEDDAGVYSCHVEKAAATKSAKFIIQGSYTL